MKNIILHLVASDGSRSSAGKAASRKHNLWARSSVYSILLVCGHSMLGAQLQYVPVSFSSKHNARLNQQITSNPAAPVGNVVYAGVPFFIPTSGVNIWCGQFDASGSVMSGSNSITFAVNATNVTEVQTLVNAQWGQPGGQYARLEFNFSTGTYIKYLVGDTDIRDWVNAVWMNNINGTSTIQVFSGVSTGEWAGNACRIDKQRIVIPESFRNSTLLSIKAVDTGGSSFQRMLLMGVTVGVVVPPAAPELSIRVSEVELCWDTATNNWYQLQYKSSLTTNEWVPFMTNWIAGDGGRWCTNDSVLAGQVQRYYRVTATNSPPE